MAPYSARKNWISADRRRLAVINDDRLKVNLAGIELKNPVMTASGTFGSGAEYSEYVDLNRLGAVVTKGVASVPWAGNPTPRIAEVYGGMLNAVGLQNPGIDVFCERDIPFLKKYDTRIIVNVCGHSEEEYVEVVKRLADEPVDALEINISCPNVREGGIAFGTDPATAERITSACKRAARQPVIMKLSPNVTSIADMARAVEAGGADAISLINTITGMKIDVNRRKFVLANRTGGMSGPAIHPVAVRMVYEAAHDVKIPVVGMGGILTWEDAMEFILAGATAVAVGTANFTDPAATVKIIDGLSAYLDRQGIDRITDLIGAVE
jgi:dihydroorotate dehydrogenase (NAD+) catalytic subunit